MTRLTRCILIAGLALSYAACGDDDGSNPPADGSISLTSPATALLEGDSLRLAVNLANWDETPTVSFRSTQPTIATVDDDGWVHGVAPGTASLIASAGSVADTVSIRIDGRPSTIAFNDLTSPVIAGSGDVTIAVVVSDARGDGVAGQSVDLSQVTDDAGPLSENPLYDGPAALTAVTGEDGTAQFTIASPLVTGLYGLRAASGDGAAALTDTMSFTVSAGSAATLIIAGADSLLLDVGDSTALSTTLVDAFGNPATGAAVQWHSSNESAATVSAAGTVLGEGVGVASIVAISGVLRDSVRAVVTLPPPSSATIAPSAATFTALHDTIDFSLVLMTPAGDTVTGQPITWSVVDEDIASVTADGRVGALANGATQVIGSSGTLADTANVTVSQAVSSIVVTPATGTLDAIGATLPLSASVADANGNAIAGATISWSSTATGVATVDASGTVSAVANGTASIIASSGAHADTSVVTVGQAVASVTISPATATLDAIDATTTFTATVEDANGNPITGASLTWASSDDAVATVDAAGTATAVANGTADVIVAVGTIADTATVTVAQSVTSISVTPAAATLNAIGATTSLSAVASDANGHLVAAAPVIWSSSNSGVATVDAAGMVTAAANGTTNVIATSGAHADTAAITVGQAVASVTITPATASLDAIDATTSFTAAVEDANGTPVGGTPVTWSTGDPLVATVDAAGLATAIGNGVAQIIATVGPVADTADLTVAQVPTALVVDAPLDTLQLEGETQQATASYTDSNGHAVAGVATTWTSSADSIASVDATGLITAEAINGSAWIRATAGSLSDSVQVAVHDVAFVLYTTTNSDTVFNMQVAVNSGAPRATAYFYSDTDSLLARLTGPTFNYTFPAALDGTTKRVEVKVLRASARQVEAAEDNIVGVFPVGILALENLATLNLARNPGLTGPIPAAIGGLDNLAALELFETGLSGTLPAQFASLTDLDILNLSSTDLTGTLTPIAPLVGLQFLSLNSATFSGALPDLSAFTQLVELQADDSGLTSYSGGLDAITAITNVQLADNELTQADVDAVLADLVASNTLLNRTGTVDLGGTNAAPSATGATDAAILTGAGWTVTTTP